MVRTRVTNEALNAELSSLTRNQKKALLGLAKAADAGGGITSIQMVREPTTTGLTKSKKKKNAEVRQIGGGGKGTSGGRPSQRNKKNKGAEGGVVASALTQKMKQVKTAFHTAENVGVTATRNSRVRRMSAKKKLKEQMPTAASQKKEKVASVFNRAKESRQAIIAAKRKQQQISGLKGTAVQAIDKKGEPSKEKANTKRRAKKQMKKTGGNASIAVKEKKIKALEPEKLEAQMNTYWCAAGKGKDPKEMKLDSSMNEYWAKKPPLEDDEMTAANN